MKIYFEDNEFTTRDLLEYLKRVYGTQINGSEFTVSNVLKWIQIRKLPDAYGGNRIIDQKVFSSFNNLKVLTIENLSRSDIENAYGNLDTFKAVIMQKEALIKQQFLKSRPRKQRTQLYYDILGSKNTTKKTKLSSTIPNNWKDVGIRATQLKRKKRSNKI